MADGDLSGITGQAVGTTIPGLLIEQVLAQIPEQTWAWDEDFTMPGGTVLSEVITPLRVRREIIGYVLGVVAGGQ